MGTSSKFWDRIADRYSRRPVADEAAYQKKLEVTRQYFRPEMQVLEFGCGTGSTAIAHAPYDRASGQGIRVGPPGRASGSDQDNYRENLEFSLLR